MQKEFVLPENFKPCTRISIVIPARDEEDNIGRCISSILKQKYPQELYEIVVVDDHSSDNTVGIVNSFKGGNISCIKLSEFLKDDGIINSYKKKALAAGISNCKGEFIVTTDADCIVPVEWLAYIAAVCELEKAVMIGGPVNFFCNNTVVQKFQSLDFMSMQGITVATHQLKMGNMCNGANLAFSKEAYNIVGGYNGIDHLASGDDYLLMLKVQAAFPGRISYLKSDKAIVNTSPQPNWERFLQQRIRWASKSGKYQDYKLTGVLLFVYLYNVSFFVLSIAGFFNSILWVTALLLLVSKTLAELVYLWPVSRFFRKRRQLILFPFLQPLHIVYIVLAGFLGFAWGYNWKGRRVK